MTRLSELIEALNTIAKHDNPDKPIEIDLCGGDGGLGCLSVNVKPDTLSDEDNKKLKEFGFNAYYNAYEFYG